MLVIVTGWAVFMGCWAILEYTDVGVSVGVGLYCSVANSTLVGLIAVDFSVIEWIIGPVPRVVSKYCLLEVVSLVLSSSVVYACVIIGSTVISSVVASLVVFGP